MVMINLLRSAKRWRFNQDNREAGTLASLKAKNEK